MHRSSFCRLSVTIAVVLGSSGCSSSSEAVSAEETPPSTGAASEVAVVAAFLGDSYTVESLDGGGYVPATAQALGWTPVLDAISGTGYVATGNQADGAPYRDRVGDVVAEDPDIVIVQGSTNDVGTPAADVGEAAAQLYDDLERRLTDARIVAVGPTAPSGVDRAAVLAIRDALRTAAGDAAIPFIDPIAANWLTPGEGLYADAIHPNQAGYDEFADDLVFALRNAGL